MTCEAWPIVWPCAAPAGSTQEQLDAAQAGAQLLLWARTGRRLGTCDAVESCGAPYMTDDLIWHNGGRSGGDVIFLTNQPVQEISEVTVDGIVQAGSTYRLEGNSRLVRVDSAWPSGLSPTVRVTYTWGVPIDPDSPLGGLVKIAMGEVGNELLQGLCGGVCRLPSRAVSVSRQGVTVQLAPAADFTDKGLLGLPLADMLITSVNPGGKRQRSRIFSPDMARRS